MSIHNILNKIKSKMGIDIFTILYLCILVFVSIASFGLGVLSKGDTKGTNDIVFVSPEDMLASSVPIVGVQESTKKLVSDNMNSSLDSSNLTSSRSYVASKNGKLYYPVSCKGSSRIKEENRVYFSSSTEAQGLGYTYASSCK